MNINIDGEKFLDVRNITGILNKNMKLIGYKVNDGIISANLEINIEYLSSVCDDTFIFNKEFETEIICENFKDMILLEYEISLIEGLGVDINFKLQVDILEIEEENKVIEIEDELDKKLKEALKDRNDSFLDDRKCMDLNEEIENNIAVDIEKLKNEDVDEKTDDALELEIDDNKEDIIEEIEVSNDSINDNIIERSFDDLSNINDKKVEIIDNDSFNDLNNIFPLFDEKNCKIRVLYLDNMSIDEICNKYNISIKKLYDDNGYEIKDRIIIKDE